MNKGSIQPLGDALVEVVYYISDNDGVIIRGAMINDAFCSINNFDAHVYFKWLSAISKEKDVAL